MLKWESGKSLWEAKQETYQGEKAKVFIRDYTDLGMVLMMIQALATSLMDAKMNDDVSQIERCALSLQFITQDLENTEYEALIDDIVQAKFKEEFERVKSDFNPIDPASYPLHNTTHTGGSHA